MSALPPVMGGEPPDDDILAGELVLGVLSSEERRRAQAREAADAGFAARVAAWERHFAPWLSGVRAITPPAYLWSRISDRLGWHTPAPRSGLWQSLALWRSVAALAALACVAIWLTRAAPPTAPAPETAKAVTTLERPDGTPGWLASVDTAHGTVLMVPVPSTPDAQGRVPELWLIPAGQAPRSLGQVSVTKSHTVAVPAEDRAALGPGAVLAITLEAPAGIPHAAPSGPIIAKGNLAT
jgi:anti-sigma-K factor RskA